MVDTTFVIAAAGAIALALAFILWPLLRRSGQPPSPALVLAVVLLVPVGTFTFYGIVGTPEGFNTAESPAHDLNQAIGQLTRRLERDPDDIEGWMLLGMTYKRLEEFTSAEQALRRAVLLDEDSAHAKVELAETILFARGQQRLPAESRLLLEQAVALDPRQQKALWLLGIGAFQDGNFDDAVGWWERLDAELDDGSVRDSVRAQIAQATEEGRLSRSERSPSEVPSRVQATEEERLSRSERSPSEVPSRVQATEEGRLSRSERSPSEVPPRVQATEEERPGAPNAAASREEDASGATLTTTVSISPEFDEELSGNETVFVYARAPNGPPMPLAIQRLRVDDLPATVRLSDQDAMTPEMRLSQFPRVTLTARVSFSGDAMAQPGDLQGVSAPLPTVDGHRVTLVIDQRIE